MSSAVRQISTDSTLNANQLLVVEALARGATVSAAARAAGLHRATLYNWFKSEPDFVAAVANAKKEYADTLRDELKELNTVALSTLRSLLDDSKTPPSVRLRTALAILQRPQFPRPGWNLPAPTGSPQEEKFRQDLAFIGADLNRMKMEDALARER